MRSNWQKIYESTDCIKAELVKNSLIENDHIEAIVINKKDSSYLLGICEIHVPIKLMDAAKIAIDNYFIKP